MRQIILDTETTGLDTADNHRIIEIGAVEMIDRRHTKRVFHHYMNPQRQIDDAAVEIHGITEEFLSDKPLFKDLADEFLQFIENAELIIHNAPFDVGFINHEFLQAGYGEKIVEAHCTILDTLSLARDKHPGQKNNLDALCKRYGVDNTQRTFHGALLDAEILADVYLQMTGGQATLINDPQAMTQGHQEQSLKIEQHIISQLPQAKATDGDLVLHQQWLDMLAKPSG